VWVCRTSPLLSLFSLSYYYYTGGQQAITTHAPGIQQPSYSYSSGATGFQEDDDCEMRHSGPIEMSAPMHGTTMRDDYSQHGTAL
jgi:hypothetical protein